MNLADITQRLLQYKVTIVILTVAAVTLPIVVAQDLVMGYLGRLGPIVVGLASAGLTSALVGMFFDLLVRIEVTEMFKAVLLESENRLVKQLKPALPDTGPLHTFWKPFVIEGTTIMLAQDELLLDGDVEPDEIIRAADVRAAVELQTRILQMFVGFYSYKDIRVNIDAIRKHDHPEVITPGNLIVIGAPGANPLANEMMARLAGIDETEPGSKNGYVFIVDPKRPYLPSPFVIPAEDGEQIGICDLQNGERTGPIVPRRWTRWDAPDNEDCALIVHGTIGLTSSQARRVLIFAGHSRRGTLEAINFATENTDWVRKVKNMGNINTESLLRTRWKTGRPETYLVSVREIRWQRNCD